MRKSAVAVGLAVVVFGCGGDWFHEVQPDGIQLLVEVLEVPAWADWGETIKVKNTIYNWGKSPVPIPFRVYFYLSDDDKYDDGTDTELAWRQIAGLDGSARDTEETDITLPGTGTVGAYYIIAYVDKDGWVAEIEGGDQDNMTAAGPMSIFDPPVGIDLIVKDVSTPTNGEWGKIWNIDYVVRNRGTQNCNTSFDVEFYISTDRDFDPFADYSLDPWGATITITSLNGQSEDSDTSSFSLPPEGILPNGNYYIVAVVDPPSGVVAETDELNNVTVSKNSAYLAQFPNLRVSFLTVPSTVYWGGTYSATVRVQNNTATAIPPGQYVYVWLLLSTDSVIELPPADIKMGQNMFTGLAAGASTDVFLSFTLPIGTGQVTRWIGAYVDATDGVMETSESDNTYSVSRTIRDGRDSYEINDTAPLATGLTLTGGYDYYYPTIYPSGDEDWFKVYATDYFSVAVSPPVGQDYDIYLWQGNAGGTDTTGFLLDYDQGVGWDYVYCPYPYMPGWYFVQVKGKSPSDYSVTDYTLRFYSD